MLNFPLVVEISLNIDFFGGKMAGINLELADAVLELLNYFTEFSISQLGVF